MNHAEHDLLVLKAQDRSRAAFGRLACHHHPGLLRYALSLARDPALAQDAVQDGWLTVVRKLRRLDDPRAFRGWLYHAVRWRVLALAAFHALSMFKLWFFLEMNRNSVLREVKRVEIELARAQRE